MNATANKIFFSPQMGEQNCCLFYAVPFSIGTSSDYLSNSLTRFARFFTLSFLPLLFLFLIRFFYSIAAYQYTAILVLVTSQTALKSASFSHSLRAFLHCMKIPFVVTVIASICQTQKEIHPFPTSLFTSNNHLTFIGDGGMASSPFVCSSLPSPSLNFRVFRFEKTLT